MTKFSQLLLLFLINLFAGCDRNFPRNGGRAESERPIVVKEVDHDALLGESVPVAQTEELSRTIVTPHLEHAIPDSTNVLWCSTFQVAWNKLCDLAGGPIALAPDSPYASILSQKKVAEDVLDPTSYVAYAGFGQEALSQIKQLLQDRFHGLARPELLPPSLSLHDWIAYSYLFQHLPYDFAFTRVNYPFTFQEKEVASFGIVQYLPDIQPAEAKMGEQVLIHQYNSRKNKFIVELLPKNRKHRILLAQIKPRATLSSTIDYVSKRIKANSPSRLTEASNLRVPIISFDIIKRYSQLEGHKIKANNTDINGTSLGIALQSIRFRLDEKGAVLKSEALSARCKAYDLVFNESFLVLLQKRGSDKPYFALWIGNAELLVPFTKKTEQADA